MFVTASDFNIPPYRIPGLDKVPTVFASFVDQEERRHLLEVLGDNLYQAFTDGFEDLPDEWVATDPTVIGQQYVYGNDIWEAVTVQTGTAPVAGSDWTLIEEDNRWLLLANGSTYMINDKKFVWVGIYETLKPLIYSKWVEYSAVELTGNGFVIPAMENNVRVDPSQFICRSWNQWSRYVGGECAQKDTLYGYLYYTNLDSGVFDDTFDETFDTFVDYLAYEFREQPTKNIFGI